MCPNTLVVGQVGREHHTCGTTRTKPSSSPPMLRSGPPRPCLLQSALLRPLVQPRLLSMVMAPWHNLRDWSQWCNLSWCLDQGKQQRTNQPITCFKCDIILMWRWMSNLCANVFSLWCSMLPATVCKTDHVFAAKSAQTIALPAERASIAFGHVCKHGILSGSAEFVRKAFATRRFNACRSPHVQGHTTVWLGK